MFEVVTFDFRIFDTENGNQIIDKTLKTPINVLMLDQIIEYIEVDSQLAIADRMKRNDKREAARRQKLAKNPFWKMACFCGLI